MANSPITRVLTQMAKAASGQPFAVETRAAKGFSFFGGKELPEAVKT
jgi:hypothetical protein